jgi:hypothetical protein
MKLLYFSVLLFSNYLILLYILLFYTIKVIKVIYLIIETKGDNIYIYNSFLFMYFTFVLVVFQHWWTSIEFVW